MACSNDFPCNLSNLLQPFSAARVFQDTLFDVRISLSLIGHGLVMDFWTTILGPFWELLAMGWDEGRFLMLFLISTDRVDVYFPPNDKDKHTKWPPSPHVLKI